MQYIEYIIIKVTKVFLLCWSLAGSDTLNSQTKTVEMRDDFRFVRGRCVGRVGEKGSRFGMKSLHWLW